MCSLKNAFGRLIGLKITCASAFFGEGRNVYPLSEHGISFEQESRAGTCPPGHTESRQLI